jgi:hypothetical protein
LQTRTAIWVAIIVILLVCLGLVYTAGLVWIVTDLSRDRQAVAPVSPSPTTNPFPTPTAVPTVVQKPATTNTPTPAPSVVQTPVLSNVEGPVLLRSCWLKPSCLSGIC